MESKVSFQPPRSMLVADVVVRSLSAGIFYGVLQSCACIAGPAVDDWNFEQGVVDHSHPDSIVTLK